MSYHETIVIETNFITYKYKRLTASVACAVSRERLGDLHGPLAV